jgi:general secretion pathway protein L
MTTLRLFLTADWPARQTACDWELVGSTAAHARLQLGHSEPRHWPAAQHCEVILSADQCLLLDAALPKAARARTPEAIGYALEEQLLGDIEAEHFVVGDSPADATRTASATIDTPVWVISRARLHTLLTTLGTLGRPPQRLISELQLAPSSPGWHLCLRPDGGFVRQGQERGFSFDASTDPTTPPLALQLACQAALQEAHPPATLTVHVADDAHFETATAQAWQHSLGLPVSLGPPYAWRDGHSQAARNLLTGDFAPARPPHESWRSLRPALLLGLIALTLYSTFSFGEWIWLERHKTQLRRQMHDSFRAAFPQARTIVDPALQMQRLSDQMRRERGQLGEGDFLPLLAAASTSLSPQDRLTRIGYDDGRLELTLQMRDAPAAERLRATLARRGFTVNLSEPRPAAGGIEAIFALRKG